MGAQMRARRATISLLDALTSGNWSCGCPSQMIMADVPLNAEIRVRNMAADRRDLVQHRRFISRLDRGDIARGAEGVDHTHRGRQANLKADTRRNVSALARRDEIEIGRPRLTGIAELAEAY